MISKCHFGKHSFKRTEQGMIVTSTMFDTKGHKWRYCYSCKRDIPC